MSKLEFVEHPEVDGWWECHLPSPNPIPGIDSGIVVAFDEDTYNVYVAGWWGYGTVDRDQAAHGRYFTPRQLDDLLSVLLAARTQCE